MGSAHGEYQRVGVFRKPDEEEDCLEKAEFIISGDEITDTSKPVNGRQVVTIVQEIHRF